MAPFIPRYVRASQTGAIKEKIRQAEALFSSCILCPRQCRVDRTKDEKGFAVSGLLVRHLVMLGRISETGRILKVLKEKVSAHTHVNLMSQYQPMGKAKKFKELSLPLSKEEFRKAFQMGKDSGLPLVR